MVIDPAAPESPCIGICTLDEHERCIGCLRTIGEIAAWSRLSGEGKRALLAELAARRAAEDR
jgi:hypothetical protein